ncbi:hypothetical protein RVR_9632 [Actinacidiphila reveromycinica]|uniref:Uncharacterized protein n=1 Tax=Actinacidiphila reveromycinica TaxID=659352 RepID=A0A7U3VSK5_9ACTN|nr:hypothetical protein [Streptomyces sp. SN-593]BBB01976.1 hypothetical protein RVR_9632 [Streptomyces sp. SN-593]
MSRGRTGHEPVEARLRDALEARAYSVGPNDLRPAAPPTVPVRSRVRVRLRRTVVGLAGLAAAAACVVVVLAPWHPTTPAPPGGTPATSPRPSPTSSSSPTPTSSPSPLRSASAP